MVMGGMVLETNMNEIVTQIDAQNKLEKSEVRLDNALVSEGSEHDHELFTQDFVAFTVCPSASTFRHGWSAHSVSINEYAHFMPKYPNTASLQIALCILLITVVGCLQIQF